MRKAYELNTYDLSMAASYGYALVFRQTTRRRRHLAARRRCLQRASDLVGLRPVSRRFMLDDMEAASRATDALLKPGKCHYLAARLVVPTGAATGKLPRR